ncbi:MAG: hypothetical protein LQ340_006283, partial [Diploschistes diacapsis]
MATSGIRTVELRRNLGNLTTPTTPTHNNTGGFTAWLALNLHLYLPVLSLLLTFIFFRQHFQHLLFPLLTHVRHARRRINRQATHFRFSLCLRLHSLKTHLGHAQLFTTRLATRIYFHLRLRLRSLFSHRSYRSHFSVYDNDNDNEGVDTEMQLLRPGALRDIGAWAGRHEEAEREGRGVPGAWPIFNPFSVLYASSSSSSSPNHNHNREGGGGGDDDEHNRLLPSPPPSSSNTTGNPHLAVSSRAVPFPSRSRPLSPSPLATASNPSPYPPSQSPTRGRTLRRQVRRVHGRRELRGESFPLSSSSSSPGTWSRSGRGLHNINNNTSGTCSSSPDDGGNFTASHNNVASASTENGTIAAATAAVNTRATATNSGNGNEAGSASTDRIYHPCLRTHISAVLADMPGGVVTLAHLADRNSLTLPRSQQLRRRRGHVDIFDGSDGAGKGNGNGDADGHSNGNGINSGDGDGDASRHASMCGAHGRYNEHEARERG